MAKVYVSLLEKGGKTVMLSPKQHVKRSGKVFLKE